MSPIYLIRHGKPASGWAEGRAADPGLDDVGRAQAVAVRDVLLALPADQRPVGVVSSPLRRCRETAEPLALALGVEIVSDPVVGEIAAPSGIDLADRGAWLRTAMKGRWREIEGDRDYEAWRNAILASVRTRPGMAVFSHYIAINAVHSLLTGDDRVVGFRPDHASITRLKTDGNRLVLVERGREAATSIL